MVEHAIVNIDISNFKGVKKCPERKRRPYEVKWSDGKLEFEGENGDILVTETYGPEELDLIKVTKNLIKKWNSYCDGAKAEC